MRRCVCPGSYDPVTNGHLDVIDRARKLFDEVTVAILHNPAKQGMFSPQMRVEMVEESLEGSAGRGGGDGNGVVIVESFSGLLVDFCRHRAIPVVVKGLRGAGDLDHELTMAQMNVRIAGVETLFLPTDPAWSFVSSSLVKEVAVHGGDVSSLVPAAVVRRLKQQSSPRN